MAAARRQVRPLDQAAVDRHLHLHVDIVAARSRDDAHHARHQRIAHRVRRLQREDRRWLLRAQKRPPTRSEEHTSELQSLMRISYAVFCLKKKTYTHYKTYTINSHPH